MIYVIGSPNTILVIIIRSFSKLMSVTAHQVSFRHIVGRPSVWMGIYPHPPWGYIPRGGYIPIDGDRGIAFGDI